MPPTITIADWKPLERNSLRGFLTAELPSGMSLHDVAIHCTSGRWWASPASRPMVGQNDLVVRGDDGKIKYMPIISFRDRATRDRFSDAVIAALRLAHPEVAA